MSTPRQHRPLGVLQVFYSPAFRWTGRRRGEVSAAIAALSLIDLFWGQAQPVDLFEPRGCARVAAGWGLLLAGAAIRWRCKFGVDLKAPRVHERLLLVIVPRELPLGSA